MCSLIHLNKYLTKENENSQYNWKYKSAVYYLVLQKISIYSKS